ncbi:MAG: LppX_LprAFG lipoprotein [Chloroflexi bacterium]|nr:LppX_LprAFG lipoprotein [Chloroflexota bacterium]
MGAFSFIRRGLAITILALGLLLLAATGCGVPDPTPEPELTLDEVLERTSDHLLSFQTAQFQMIDEMESGRKFFEQTLKSVDGKVQAPDRTDLLVNVESPVLGFVQIGIIAVGDSAMMQFASGAPWNPLPLDQVPFNFSGLGMTLSDLLPKIQNIELTGRETVNGIETIRIDGDLVSEDLKNLITSADSGHPIDLTVWVDAEDQSLRQIRIVGNVFNDDGPGTSRLIILSEYDEPVDIQLPG